MRVGWLFVPYHPNHQEFRVSTNREIGGEPLPIRAEAERIWMDVVEDMMNASEVSCLDSLINLE